MRLHGRDRAARLVGVMDSGGHSCAFEMVEDSPETCEHGELKALSYIEEPLYPIIWFQHVITHADSQRNFPQMHRAAGPATSAMQRPSVGKFCN